MSPIVQAVISTMAAAMVAHGFLSFVSFWLLPKGIVADIRRLRFTPQPDDDQFKALPMIPKMLFKAESADTYMFSNYQLTFFEKFGIPTLKVLIALTVGLWALGAVLGIVPVQTTLNELAPPGDPYPWSAISNALIFVGVGTYVAYFVVFTKLDVLPLLCDVDERYKKLSPLMLVIRMGA
ncbi:hypothetical protein [Hyphomonas sp.]|uniref:hypothetical protein n=1 Tax=Hyphomonas sp. TaxID=87 RepID=UPI0025C34538|nr:hypothetical protein [Hyphomonas sp.]